MSSKTIKLKNEKSKPSNQLLDAREKEISQRVIESLNIMKTKLKNK